MPGIRQEMLEKFPGVTLAFLAVRLAWRGWVGGRDAQNDTL
jgi:hypothetical protein